MVGYVQEKHRLKGQRSLMGKVLSKCLPSLPLSFLIFDIKGLDGSE